MLPVYTPWKHLKTFAFLVFSEGIKREHWPEMSLRVLRGFKFLLNLQTRSFCFYKKNAALHKYFHIKKKKYLATAQSARTLSVAMFRPSREYLGNMLKKNIF